MIDVKEASQRSIEYLKGLIEKIYELTLEEVELSDDEQFWFVTLGYNKEQAGYLRVYKQIKILAEDGKFISMKNIKM